MVRTRRPLPVIVMFRFFTLYCISLSYAAGQGDPAHALVRSPNELVILSEGVTDETSGRPGKHVILVIRVYCRPDKTGVQFSWSDPITGEKFGEPVFFPIDRDNGRCDPKQILAKFRQGAFGPSFTPLPPTSLFSPLPRAVSHADSNPRWLYESDPSGRAGIQVRDPDTLRPVASIDTEPRLIGGMARSPVGERLYATLWRSTTTTPPLPAQIAVIDTNANRIEDRITLTGDMLPSAPVISPDGQLLYFADESQGLVVVDLAGKSILERIPAARAGNANNQFFSLALSPDGLILCLTDSAGVALLDTRTRTFIARINLTLMKRSIPPVFHPNGSLFYLVDRRTVSGSTAVSLVSYNTSDLTEAARVTLPSTFDPYNAIVTPHGASLALDGFLRPAGQTARGVLLMVDLVRNRLTSTDESVGPSVGALGVVVR
jgi:hypothetical protein